MKMLSKMRKGILGVAFGAFALSLTIPVNAEEVNWCVDTIEDTDLITRYGLTLVDLGNNQYSVQMNPGRTDIRCDVKFTVTPVGSSTSYDLTCTQDANFTMTSFTDTSYGLPGVVVNLSSDSKIIRNENETGSCYYRGGSAQLEISSVLDPYVSNDACPEAQREDTTLTIPSINCDNNYAEGTFEYKFCYAKRMAKETDNPSSNETKRYYEFENGRGYSGSTLNFKCNYDLNSGKVPLPDEKLTGDEYFVNKDYLYGTSSQVISFGSYQYHYSPGVVTYGENISCKVTCEEAIEVEYGPPVASKAGMCFEYKVRVTSRTSCNMSQAPKPPKLDCSYCTPTPRCVGTSGKVFQQGGPNEEFDACVKRCDGGKYSKSCSSQCYKQVYGNSSGSKLNYSFYEDFYATKLAYSGSMDDCIEMNPIGCYARYSNGEIYWKTGTHPSTSGVVLDGDYANKGEGRWYYENPNGRYHNGSYILDDNGFWRRLRDDGSICTDNCSWTGCDGDVYLNPGMGAKDYEENIQKYNNAVTACKSKATCSTTTAEFTISTDYTKGGTSVVTTIEFPYDTHKDTITHTNRGVNSTASNATTTLLPNYPSSGTGLLGCYKSGSSESNLYRSTWSFPGTWINLKTGEISFASNASGSAWEKYDKKFCIPNDAKSVNSDWWNAYYRKTIDQRHLHTTVTTVDDSVCYETTTHTIYDTTYDTKTMTDIIWNIHAKTEKFGYYGWSIQMDCFYALNPMPTKSTDVTPDSDTTPKSCVPGPTNYRVRSIDLKNVFPDTKGNDSSPSNADRTTAGRTPGFNWSEYATNTKTENYTSNPVEYMKKIQSKEYYNAIYTDEYLDYEFYLSPSTIREMRKGGLTGNNYTNFENENFKVDSNGISRYRSQKIRGLGSDNKIANDTAIQCNNMKNYHSTECDDLS